jgi:hypothetical protein
MDRDLLTGYLDRGLSLIEIGTLTNRDPSTVGYWVKKHGLMANGQGKYALRGGLTREQLEPLVESGATLKEMAEALDRSVSSVRHWLGKHGLATKNARGRRPKSGVDRAHVEQAIGAGSRTVPGECERHGHGDFAIVGSRRRLHCKRCRAEAVARRRRKVKEINVAEAGGECVLCGYSRCLAALHFHHVDPKSKAFGLAHRGITLSLERVREEARKCVLLCANCHAEVEAGFTDL